MRFVKLIKLCEKETKACAVVTKWLNYNITAHVGRVCSALRCACDGASYKTRSKRAIIVMRSTVQ